MAMQIYTVAAVHETTDEQGKEVGFFAVEPTPILAKDYQQALVKAARMIPDQYDDMLDEIKIFVQPFSVSGSVPSGNYIWTTNWPSLIGTANTSYQSYTLASSIDTSQD